MNIPENSNEGTERAEKVRQLIFRLLAAVGEHFQYDVAPLLDEDELPYMDNYEGGKTGMNALFAIILEAGRETVVAFEAILPEMAREHGIKYLQRKVEYRTLMALEQSVSESEHLKIMRKSLVLEASHVVRMMFLDRLVKIALGKL